MHNGARERDKHSYIQPQLPRGASITPRVSTVISVGGPIRKLSSQKITASFEH